MDYLSLSNINKINIEGINNTIVFSFVAGSIFGQALKKAPLVEGAFFRIIIDTPVAEHLVNRNHHFPFNNSSTVPTVTA